ncbi:YecH family metal-binding protein [Psychromonas sp. KJ10-10]|uniref:YecH family metal-binding protein n=1 Tax=Psychromonas sp. KJ10-10 TaxID=3391823 RepID=UPI0039B6D16E
MSESIHGHQVMEMMATSGKSYNKVELKSEIASKFGAEARFHTCMGSDLTADDLIEFLASKGKIIESEQGMSMPEEHLC